MPVETKILVIGSYGIGNLGDDALMMIIVRILLLHYSDHDIFLYCPDKPYLQRLLPTIKVIEPDPNLVLRGQLLLYGGGTQFFSYQLTGSTFTRRLKKALLSPQDAFRYLLRKALSIQWEFGKSSALGIGIGPFVPNSRKEIQTKILFKKLGFVAVRDPASLEFCRGWGISHTTLRSDLCFLDNYAAAPPTINKRTIAIIIRDWPHTLEGAAYAKPLLESLSRFRAEGYKLTFFSFCHQEDCNLINLLRELHHQVIVWDPEKDDPVGFIRQLQRHQVIITGRYHGALFSGMLGKPSICIEIEPKLRVAAETLNLADYLWQQPFKADSLTSLINLLVANYDNLSSLVEAAVQRQQIQAEIMLQEFREYIRC